jgi:hypothetical protein
MEEHRLSFALMLSYLNRVLTGGEDSRQRSNMFNAIALGIWR